MIARLTPTKVTTKYTTSITNQHNMLDNVDSTTFGRITVPQNTSNIEIYLSGFTFSDLPSNAIPISMTIKAKGYGSGGNSSYYAQLCAAKISYTTSDGISSVEKFSTNWYGYIGPVTSTAIGKATAPSSITWDQVKTWGENFAIAIYRIPALSSSIAAYYIYGAELDIEYTLPVNKVTVNKNGTLETLIDLTADTVTPETLLSGYTAHDKSGSIITGTYEAGIPSNYGLITWDGSVLTVS